jgi:hypothetical protein
VSHVGLPGIVLAIGAGTVLDQRLDMSDTAQSMGMPTSNDTSASTLGLEKRSLRTPRSAAYAGIVFAVLLSISIVTIFLALPAHPADSPDLLLTSPQREILLVGLSLVPFAGVAFLWFVGAIRDRVGDREDRFFQTVFLGSGILFVAMLLAAEAFATGLVLSLQPGPQTFGAAAAVPDWWRAGRNVCNQLLESGLQMAGVFTTAASVILLRTGAAPRWLAVSGSIISVLLIVAVFFTGWIGLLFPLWIFALSVDGLIVLRRQSRDDDGAAPA